MDSNHGRRAYETRVAPRVTTVAGLGVEPSSLLASGYEPDRHTVAGSLRRSRAESNSRTTLRKRGARSTSESSSVPRRSRTFASWLRKPAAGSAGRDIETSPGINPPWERGDVPRDRAEPLQVCSPQRTPVLHVIASKSERRESNAHQKTCSYQSASFAHEERAPRFELGWYGLEGRLLA